MNDAAEVLDTLYTSLEAVAGEDAPVNAVFSLHIMEAVHCGSCGKMTHHQENKPASLFPQLQLFASFTPKCPRPK